jgi:DNA mismatch endonuclease, patch repair protein
MPGAEDPRTRSQLMAGIRGRDTVPELQVRRALHARGFRYSTNPVRLPGRPDVVLTRWKVAVFVHGCFWHLHKCSLSRVPGSNVPFWEKKLSRNAERDVIAALTLISMDWRVATVWECALRGSKARATFDGSMDQLSHWIRHETDTPVIEIAGGMTC